MNIIAGYYTNNNIRQSIIQHSLNSFLSAAENGPVIPIVSSWDPIPNLQCKNVISRFRLNGYGHLNILLQLLQIVQATDEPWDYFAFCEHDCLYPSDYFADIERRLSDDKPPGIASEHHIGLFPCGFADCQRTPMQPLFAMVMRKECLMESLYTKIKECAAKGWCCLEPDDRSGWCIVKPNSAIPPIVHVNMNMTDTNHHLTNAYDFYSVENAEVCHEYWGNLRDLEIYTQREIDNATNPIIPKDTYRILSAQYGHFDDGRTVSYLPALERKNCSGLFRVSNAEAGSDPAPGIVKSLRLQVAFFDARESTSYVFKEGSVFCL